jgi:hypothetical protein
MLKPEEARKQLEKILAGKSKVKPIDRCAALSPAAAEAFLALWGLDKNGKLVWYGGQELQKHIDFLAQNPAERRQVFDTFFGPLSPHIETAWKFFDKLPYTRGYGRRPFRAPTRPEASNERRGDWLSALSRVLREYPHETLTPAWLAAWAVHIYAPHQLGYLFASIIEEGGPVADEVLQILKDSAASQHDIGGMGAHVCRALLCSSRPDAWEFMGKLLLAAQRQEGLRQSILEAVDEAHPGAFALMLKLVREEDLVRFSSVVRAAGVWLGQVFEAISPGKVKEALQLVQTYLDDPDARRKAIDKGTMQECRTALWCTGFEDVTQLLDIVPAVLKHKDADRRLEMVRLLEQTGLPELMDIFLPLLDDADLRVVKTVLIYFSIIPYYGGVGIETRYLPSGRTERLCRVDLPPDLFERLEKVIERLPETPLKLKMAEDDELADPISKANAADLLNNLLGERSAERLVPHFKVMSEGSRAEALRRLAAVTPMTPAIRELLLENANAQHEYVRQTAVEALKKLALTNDEVVRIEGYLVRKAERLRLSLFAILMSQPDDAVLATIDRLLQAGEANQRLAGIELGRQLQVARRQRDAIHARMVAYHDSGKRLTKAELDAIKPLLVPPAEQFSLDDCLGLIDPNDRSPVTPPERRNVQILSPAGAALLRSLDDLVQQHKDKTFTVEYPNGHKADYVLGSAYYGFPSPMPGVSAADDRKKLPLGEIWEEWWQSRPEATRDADGLELVRAALQPVREVREGEEDGVDDEDDSYYGEQPDELHELVKKALAELVPGAPVRLRHPPVTCGASYGARSGGLLAWLAKLHPLDGGPDLLLDTLETVFAAIPKKAIDELPELPAQNRQDWRPTRHLGSWLQAVRGRNCCHGWNAQHDARLFRLLHWLDQPTAGAPRFRPEQHELLNAYKAGACTLADIYDDLIGPPSIQGNRYYYGGTAHHSLNGMTQARHGFGDLFTAHPEVKQTVDRCVERILEIELARGEAPTVATPLANSIAALQGADTLFRLLTALGNVGFSRKYESWRGPADSKAAVLTRLVRVTSPLPTDKPKAFAARARELIKQRAFSQDMIVELGLLNPYWLSHVEETVAWPGYSEAVWWFIAHVPNPFDLREQQGGDEEYNKTARAWQAIVKARTDLTPEQRYEGIIDVAWFHRAYQALNNARRWDAIEEAAKFLQRGQSHKRAARLADVLLGKAKKKELVEGIRKKNLKEYVRLLGLLPLPADAKKQQSELQDRYRVLRDYERYAKGLSSLSKEPALRAVRLGLENLAVTAGLADPMRLEWHVTRVYVADLRKGPVSVKVKEVNVTLELTGLGEPEMTQTKNGKPVKAVPPDIKKTPKVAELFDRRTDLKRMASSTRLSLEMAMCRGDAFTGRELQDLMDHAIVRPLLERLVLQHDGARGYPVKNGKALETHNGKTAAVKATDRITIAHPLDLLAGKDWHHWQKDCFARERLQPFKQIFREIYVATRDEEHEGDRSRRYAGHQLNPQQAMALFGQRGWSTREGIEKLFRDDGIIAEVYFNGGYTTPADVESPTLELVGFRRRDSWQLLALKKVPKKIFSEVMRDLDLVVSVAHVGGVDPEASASTIDMRGALLTETFALLSIKNVKLDSRHALIKGQLGSYSVHLGSGVVHKQPGGAVCMVPVHSQHRGRLFLPFADNDPKTAEVVSKVLLLARDNEIQDPTILQQITLR